MLQPFFHIKKSNRSQQQIELLPPAPEKKSLNLLSKVYLPSDIQMVLNAAIDEGLISKTQSEELCKIMESIVFHPQLKSYFSTDVEVYNEREIMTSTGQIIIPDRLVITQAKCAVIIDYKTGVYYDKHKQQLENYATSIASLRTGCCPSTNQPLSVR